MQSYRRFLSVRCVRSGAAFPQQIPVIRLRVKKAQAFQTARYYRAQALQFAIELNLWVMMLWKWRGRVALVRCAKLPPHLQLCKLQAQMQQTNRSK
jgi:hypothetical protein